MTHGFGVPGLRCTAKDPSGNRCTKDFTHMDSTVAWEQRHSASVGIRVQQWA